MKIKILNPGEMLNGNNSIEDIGKLSKEIYETKSVLGVDIYKYSEYAETEQMYIPVLFDLLYKKTIRTCIQAEPFIFQHYTLVEKDFIHYFISTGDGGYQLFNTPLEALVFAIYFQLQIKRFNSGGSKDTSLKQLHEMIGNIDLRYSITVDKIYGLGNNFYGPAIINNARILSKDNLNRLLIDENAIRWFDNNINSVENLTYITLKEFPQIKYFEKHDTNLKTELFSKENNAIKAIDILKIGNIKAKNRELKIYNLHLQAGLLFSGTTDKEYSFYSMTLGNLNTQGIE